MDRKIKLYEKSTRLDLLISRINKAVLVVCWIAVICDISYYAITSNLLMALIYSMFTPLRYFLFDIAPSKLQKRPAELDRSVPLNIFVTYLAKKFPIPQGNTIATIIGLFIASARMWINGYALLIFDTFTFFFKTVNDKNGIPLHNGNRVLQDNEDLLNLEKLIMKNNSESEEESLQKAKSEWQKSASRIDLDEWDFPLRRYLSWPSYYFENNEIGVSMINKSYEEEEEEQEETDEAVKKSKQE